MTAQVEEQLEARSSRSLARQSSVVGRDVNIVAAKLDRVNSHRLDRRHAERAAGSHIEAGTMARALDLAADQFAFGKGPPSWVQTSSMA